MGAASSNGVDTRRRLVRLPLVPVVVAMAAGIAAGRYGPLNVGAWAVIGACGLGLVAATIRRKHLHLATSIGVLVAVAGIGAVHLQISYFSFPDNHIVTYTDPSRMPATLRGRVVTSPQVHRRDIRTGMGYSPGPETRFVLEATELSVRVAGGRHTDRAWEPVEGLVRAAVGQADRRLAAGQQLELVGRIGRFRGADNPGQFDPAAAARDRRTLVWMRVPGVDGVTVRTGTDTPWYAATLWRVRAAARQHLMALGDDQSAHLLTALVLGERDPALRRLNRAMVRAGVAHFLSISGLHLGVFLAFVFGLCRLAMLPARRAAAVVLVILAAYVLLAEPRAPLLRSAVMAAALCIAVMIRRPYTALNALAAAGICLLAVDPLQLFDAGFQLSFVIVAGLLVLHRPVRNLLFGRWRSRRGLMVFRQEDRLRRWLTFSAADLLMNLVTAALTAYIVAAPLVAYHFGLFSPYAAPLSILLLPMVVAVLVPGYLAIALAGPMPNLSYSFARLAAAAADGLAAVVELADDLPGLAIELRQVSAGWVLVCYAAVLLVAGARRRRHRVAWAIAAVLAVAGATIHSQWPAAAPRRPELNLLAVGSGQCAVLRTPSGRTVLIDAGSSSGYDAYESVLKPFLLHGRLPRPVEAFVSHGNVDHFNGLFGAVDDGGLESVWVNEHFGQQQATGPASKLIQVLGAAGTQVRRLRAGRKIPLGGTDVEVIWPMAAGSELGRLSANDRSLVLRITCGQARVLLPGDIGADVQAKLARKPESIRADVLVLPHHGSWTPSLPAFVKAVDPRIVLVSGYGMLRGLTHADRTRREFYRELQRTRACYDTGRCGWIQVRFGDPGQARVRTMR